MARSRRLRRPPLERTAPIRNWSAAVSAAPSADPPKAGVQNANRVVEEYLRAGEASARLFQGAGAPGNPQDLGQAMVRAASDMMAFWVELMARSAGGTAPAADGRQPPASSHADAPTEPLRVRVTVDSARPTEVLVDLRPDGRSAALRVERLHASNGSARSLAGGAVAVSCDRGAVSVRLRIAPTQPAGLYRGVIVDEATSAPVGALSVEVQSAGGRRRRVRR